MIVLHSSSADVYENLAAEDVLLDEAGAEPVVFIYRNAGAVVLGKNQNPWRECAVSRLEALGVKLARRVSGGGTVFHDSGNLNIACVVPRAQYERSAMLHLFIDGLAAAGVRATIENSTSLVVDGRKVSGNAFCYRRDKVLHHGTFLLSADLERMHRALQPEIAGMETRAVASVRMPVMNLGGVVDESALLQRLIDALATRWGTTVAGGFSPFQMPEFAARVQRMATWEWLYGATPDFRLQRDGQTLQVIRGRLEPGGEPFRA